MKRSFLIALAAIGFASATSAQNSQYVYFSTRFAETADVRPRRPHQDTPRRRIRS